MRTMLALIKLATKFAAAQRAMAGCSTEDGQYWHHVALADLLTEMATMIERLCAENTKLRAALEEISAVYGELDVTPSRMCAIARTALTGKE